MLTHLREDVMFLLNKGVKNGKKRIFEESFCDMVVFHGHTGSPCWLCDANRRLLMKN